MRHLAVNACLAPLCSVAGMAVTTVEGIGSTRTALHPVQVRALIHNATEIFSYTDLECDLYKNYTLSCFILTGVSYAYVKIIYIAEYRIVQKNSVSLWYRIIVSL